MLEMQSMFIAQIKEFLGKCWTVECAYYNFHTKLSPQNESDQSYRVRQLENIKSSDPPILGIFLY